MTAAGVSAGDPVCAAGLLVVGVELVPEPTIGVTTAFCVAGGVGLVPGFAGVELVDEPVAELADERVAELVAAPGVGVAAAARAAALSAAACCSARCAASWASYARFTSAFFKFVSSAASWVS